MDQRTVADLAQRIIDNPDLAKHMYAVGGIAIQDAPFDQLLAATQQMGDTFAQLHVPKNIQLAAAVLFAEKLLLEFEAYAKEKDQQKGQGTA